MGTNEEQAAMADAPDEAPGDEQGLHFDVQFIIKRVACWPRYRRGMGDLTASCIAREIIQHLRLSNWRFYRGPPTAGHSTPGPRR
jgi:hypothetical protein